MDSTKLIYPEDMQKLTHETCVMGISEEDGKTVVLLDETIFYPQGGGQPYDQGVIENESGKFIVEEVRFVDGVVRHIGHFEKGSFSTGQEVALKVDPERRALHARLHSAGHVLDMAVNELGLPWIPGKGYHFPDGPYIEYDGSFEEAEKENLQKQIESAANKFIAAGIQTSIQFMPKSEMHKVCANVPDYLPEGKPARVVLYGTFGVPCGGTHVANLKDIGHLMIRKISNKKGLIRVGYDVT
ncbi:MAG: alanine--tRNA ligase-related protein [Patescibacteria group bacterium]